MGRLVDGKWVKTSIITSNKKGEYDRIPRSFLNTISKDHKTFQPEKGRYHLYVSYACPWAHRTLIVRKLKGLEDYVSVSVVHPDLLEDGWHFETNFDGATGDDLYQAKFLYELYQKAQSDVSTSVTVPVLWDKKTKTIVNNESSEIIRIFNTEFNHLTNNTLDLYPAQLQSEIDSINEKIYHDINNGVYKSGFAKTQEAYNSAVNTLFNRLDEVEKHLEGKSFLVGDQLTEADIRFVTTLLRFDLVYFGHFKCNKKRIKDYKNIFQYMRNLYELDAVQSTSRFDHIKRHYYYSHETINPTRIVPVGVINF